MLLQIFHSCPFADKAGKQQNPPVTGEFGQKRIQFIKVKVTDVPVFQADKAS